MKVSMEWLSEYVDFDLGPDKVASLLSMSGTEVDKVTSLGSGVEGILVGRVVGVREHPNAENLRVVMVEDGSIVRQIVCGAPNLSVGMKTALALPGARLPLVSESMLKRANIRGVESDGMLCSGAEIGITSDASTIIELDREAEVGMDLGGLLPLQDVVLTLEITPNRPDCMSVIGVAREIAALTGLELKAPELNFPCGGPPATELARVEVKDPGACTRYSATVITGVEVGPSPPWMQRRLIATGFRPINNIVDATNYVLAETGQPLHAFDLGRLKDRTIIVRLARQGEVLSTLDGVDRQLDERALLIADTAAPLALAGIMGGLESEVTESTTDVLIESAHFDPTSILLTSKRLGLRTEASSRFERGTDPGGTVYAASRAAMLMLETAGGKISSGVIDVCSKPAQEENIELRPEKVRGVLGEDITDEMMLNILEKLEMKASKSKPFLVKVPTFRGDIDREIDLIEEIARVFGYEKIEESLPAGGGLEAGLSEEQKLTARIDGVLVAQGLMETVNYSLIEAADLEALKLSTGDSLMRAVRVVNPISGVGETLRTTMVPGLLRTAAINRSRGNSNLRLFERGKVFFARETGELPLEIDTVGLLLAGRRGEPLWGTEGAMDLFDLKGIVENLGDALGLDLDFEESERPYLESGHTTDVMIAGRRVGYVGRSSSAVLDAFELDGDIYLSEIEVGPLVEEAGRSITYSPVGRYPSVKVDIAVVVDEYVPSAAVEAKITEYAGHYLLSVELFDVYEGQQIPEGQKSLAFALEFGSHEGTLTDAEAHSRVDAIVKGLETDLGATLRGQRQSGSME